MDTGTIIDIIGLGITLVLGVGAFFVKSSTNKTILKKNKIKGDYVAGDKVGRDKVEGDKIEFKK